MVFVCPQDVKCIELRVRLWTCGSLRLLEKTFGEVGVHFNGKEGVGGEGEDKGV